ncbi:hypothetical protein [Campylobacter sp. MG1]|uniref:hypothetical protein n=1 Tax=Campylobacter sp. MG1 TaxID=2976332 RepID=UPI00226C8893|nr:hypothetical protein [Campylobacter sp. MG1]
MIRFAIFLILFFALIGVCIYYKEKLGSKLYIFVMSFIIISSLVAFIYTAFDNSEGILKQKILNAYMNDEILDCSGVKVNKKTHNFNNGTSVFIDNVTYEKTNMFKCEI